MATATGTRLKLDSNGPGSASTVSNASKKTRPALNTSRAARYPELGCLLEPVLPEEFAANYWGRKPLFIKGNAAKLQRLIPGGFTALDFFKAVEEGAARRLKDFVLCGGVRHGILPDDNEQPFFPSVGIDQMEAILGGGGVLLSQCLYDTRLAAFAAAVKTQLRHAGDVQIFASLSGPGNVFRPHFDRVCGLFIQFEGAKRFLISNAPVIDWPRGTASISSDGTGQYTIIDEEPWDGVSGIDLRDLTEIIMEPGDVLYLPAGTIHATEAISEGSLGFNIGFIHSNFITLISRTLESMLVSNPAWRHLLMSGPATQKPGELPAEAAAFFAERLEEIRDAISTLTPESFELNREWQRMVAHPGESSLATLSLAPPQSATRAVERTDIIRLSNKAPITYAEGTDDQGEAILTLFFAAREVTVAGEWVPFLRTMTRRRRFKAASASGWAGRNKRYRWREVREYLQALIGLGVLEFEAE
jgi:ribosomal protein L16 Arg81 hydroxylase